jgi:hypothetical protein
MIMKLHRRDGITRRRMTSSANNAWLSLLRFRAVAARYVLETADSTVLVQAADALLDAGIHTWSVGELATTAVPSLRDIDRLFGSALRELGIPLPSPEEAARILARWHLYGVIEERVTPSQAMERLRDELSYPLRYDRRLNAIEPQLRFVSYWYRYDNLFGMAEDGYLSREEAERMVAELDTQVLEHARSWMSEEGRSLVESNWLSWNGGIVRKLAQAIADEQAWDQLPILADALEEAGCRNSELIEHFRAGEPHVSCCWILDIMLQQETSRQP